MIWAEKGQSTWSSFSIWISFKVGLTTCPRIFEILSKSELALFDLNKILLGSYWLDHIEYIILLLK